MANNQNLKDAISAVIKENGNNEITGPILQSVLLSIINQFGSGAIFAGVAYPNTVPQNNDTVSFYIAYQNGVYVNFGGYVNDDNSLVIFSNASGIYESVASFNVSGIQYIKPIGPGTENDPTDLPDINASYKYIFEAASGYYRYGTDIYNAEAGKRWIFFAENGTWSLVDMGELPMQDITGLTEKGGYEGTAQDLDDKIDSTASDIYKNILDGVVDYEVDLDLTPGRFISLLGDASFTVGDYKATLDYIPLNGASKIFYKGSVGIANSRIAFYREPILTTGSFISHFPNENTEFKEGEIEVPEGANYIRATFHNTDVNGARLVLKNYPIPSDDTPLYDFRIIGEPSYDANGVIQSANIIWNDNSTGVVTYTNWNESEFTYAGFSATSNENGKVVTQPPVTFNSDGSISNYPNFIIANI